jgi:hypothetical protein
MKTMNKIFPLVGVPPWQVFRPYAVVGGRKHQPRRKPIAGFIN